MMEDFASAPGQLSQADALLRQGKPREAGALCQSILANAPDHPAALHLLGLARGRLGSPTEAEQLLRRSIQLEPKNRRFRVNFGNFLRRVGRLTEAEQLYRAVLIEHPDARRARLQLVLTLDETGRVAEAEAECRRLLGDDPSDAEAWSTLGTLLARQRRPLEAEQAYRQALALAPNRSGVHQRLGRLLLEMERAAEALHSLERAAALGRTRIDLRLARAEALCLLGRIEEAEQDLVRVVAERPRDAEAQRQLAHLRFRRTDPLFTRAIEAVVRAAPDDLPLQSLLVGLLLQAGRLESAETRIRDVMKRCGSLPPLRIQLAQVLLEQGRLREAETEALETAAMTPRNANVIELVVSILLARGRPEDALPFIATQRQQEPLAQTWIAYEALAARLLGKPHYRALYDYGRWLRTYRIEPPPGWSSIAELNADLLEVLRTRHVLPGPPLRGSLRQGSQARRNPLTDDDRVMRALLSSFAAPLQAYIERMGYERDHPFTARNRGAARLNDCWSVQMRCNGFHVNHVHPSGWISSAYYVDVPAEVENAELRPGWLKLGEPRHPTPAAGPDFMVKPEPGLLVLFPSYVWHGTTPIQGDAPRTAIAFDALPVP
ncbi:MAG TPA: tetratricopeptide repeat protein [Steroidobacteraceae bacterium]|nr:tetratricopeptide repeat protein [Steroidobacteraceae bacterium]